MFPSFTGFASFARALVAVAGKMSVADLVRAPVYLVLGMEHRARAGQETSSWKRGTSEVASLLAEEPCRGAWPESRQK